MTKGEHKGPGADHGADSVGKTAPQGVKHPLVVQTDRPLLAGEWSQLGWGDEIKKATGQY